MAIDGDAVHKLSDIIISKVLAKEIITLPYNAYATLTGHQPIQCTNKLMRSSLFIDIEYTIAVCP